MTTEERLEKLEIGLVRAKRHNRLLLTVVIMVFGLLAIAATSDMSSREKIIEANRFNLLDENGKTRAFLATNKDGTLLAMVGSDGKRRVCLAVANDEPGLALYDADGKLRASLTLLKDGPTLALSDDNGKPRDVLATNKDGPMLTLLDGNGKNRACLGINKTTTPDGKVITYPESSLLLFDPNGKVIWEAPR
jgi:hypothetical protein